MSEAAKRPPGYRSQDKGHKRKPCIDCKTEGITTKRPSPYPGPRCASHHRVKKAQRKDVTREQRWQQVYNLSAEDYWAIHAQQNGRCYICQRATGTGQRRLSVDHCHKTGMVRGLLCMRCNKDILGFARDEIEFFERAIDYLTSPPAVEAIGIRYVPEES